MSPHDKRGAVHPGGPGSAGVLSHSRWAIPRFLGLYLCFVALFVGLFQLETVQGTILTPLNQGIARWSSVLLNLLGEQTRGVAGVLSSSKISLLISTGCNGVETFVLLGSAVLAFPATLRAKGVGVALVLAVIFALNFVG